MSAIMKTFSRKNIWYNLVVNSDIEPLGSWIAGFKRGHDRLEELRMKEIRESDIVTSISAFELAFESAKKLGLPREARSLSKVERILLSVEK